MITMEMKRMKEKNLKKVVKVNLLENQIIKAKKKKVTVKMKQMIKVRVNANKYNNF